MLRSTYHSQVVKGMPNFETIIQVLSENKFSNLNFHVDNVTVIQSSSSTLWLKQNSKNQEKFYNFIQSHLKEFHQQVVNAYLDKKVLENLEENLNKLQIDTDFIFNFTSNWMLHLSENVKNTNKINQLFLPGTHNSCTTQIFWSLKPVCMSKAQFFGSKLPLIRNIVKNIVVNQTKTIVEQVQAGIRLFDLRIATNGHNKIYIAHTYYVYELEQCLKEFKYCLTSYTNEIFVINFKVDYPYNSHFSKEDLKTVQEQFHSILGSFILPCNQPLETIANLVSNGKRLIVYCNLDDKFLDEKFENLNDLFRVSRSYEIWPNEDRLVKVEQKLRSILENSNSTTKSNEFIYFSFNTTPKLKPISLNCSIISPSESQIKFKENIYKVFLREVTLNHISGVILDNPTFNLIQESIALNFRK